MNRIALSSAGALMAVLLAGAMPANAAGCQLGSHDSDIKHIVYIQFDNVHLRRDNLNVPSDLEQMPNLLHFLEQEGALLTNHHTPLISHTSVDILTSLTGVYGEKMGMPIGNTILYFVGGSSNFTSSFAYWTDNLGTRTPLPAKTVPQMVDQRGKIHPAPWVPFTRAGCDVGAFSIANIEFENVGSDIDNVFGPTSDEHNEAKMNMTWRSPTSKASSFIARKAAHSAAVPSMPRLTSSRTNRAATTASKPCSATNTSHRRSTIAPPSSSTISTASLFRTVPTAPAIRASSADAAHTFLQDAVNDYAGRYDQGYISAADSMLKHIDPELYSALEQWSERPELPPVELIEPPWNVAHALSGVATIVP